MKHTDDDLHVMAFIEAAPFAFGRHLATLRKVRGWSQEKLALESGMARSYLGGIERGHRNVSLKNLVKLARCLNLPAPVLMNFSVDDNLVQLKLKTLMQAGATDPSMSEGSAASARAKGVARKRETDPNKTVADQHGKNRSVLHEANAPYDAEEF